MLGVQAQSVPQETTPPLVSTLESCRPDKISKCKTEKEKEKERV